MKTKEEILADLPQFYGTEHYYTWSALFPNFVMTDGVRYLANAADCYWLLNAIASHRSSYRDEEFVVAKFSKLAMGGWELDLSDGNDNGIASQTIGYSDFPLDEITLYVIPQGDLWVVLLTSEY